MANKEHVAILKQGVEVWNKWREENKEVRPDLEEATLTGANLIGANLIGATLLNANLLDATLRDADLLNADLSHANLTGATLSEATLSRADLGGADLGGADLRGASLGYANLNEANLSRADLSHANLNKANLSRAYLNKVTLSHADLGGADLSRTDLRGASLGYANLIGANLSLASLSAANLSKARVSYTVFSNTNLSAAAGLDTCYHFGPSTIDHLTLVRSGDLPKAFLQGCGLPDWLIEAYKLAQLELTSEDIHTIGYEAIRLRDGQAAAIQFYSCFISYSHQDKAFARVLHDALQAQGVRCWFAPEDMKIGSRIRPAIDDAIRLHDKLLIILSEHSVESQWVEGEVESALEREEDEGKTILFPIRLDDAVMGSKKGWASFIKRTRHIGDFCQWDDKDAYAQAFDKLLQDLQAS